MHLVTHWTIVVVLEWSGMHTELWHMSNSVNTFPSLLAGRFLLSPAPRVDIGRDSLDTTVTANQRPSGLIAVRVCSVSPFAWFRRFSRCGLIKPMAKFSRNSDACSWLSFGCKSGLLKKHDERVYRCNVKHSMENAHWPTTSWSCYSVPVAQLVNSIYSTFRYVVFHDDFGFLRLIVHFVITVHSWQKNDGSVTLRNVRHQSCCCSESKQWRTNIFRPAGKELIWDISRLLFLTIPSCVNFLWYNKSANWTDVKKLSHVMFLPDCSCGWCAPVAFAFQCIICSDKYLRHIKTLTDLMKRKSTL